jgi:hypothetical protein
MFNQEVIIMRAITIKVNTQFFLLILVFGILTGGCNKMSEIIVDKTAVLNGGFEVSKNGLPVNWLMYTPNTVPDADFQIILDKEIFKEGKQSLKFNVKKCSSIGGWKSPGFTNEFFEVGRYRGEGRYKLSFWVKNAGAEFSITAGGVSAQGANMTTLIKEHEQIDDWKLLEYEIDVPTDRWLRMQLNILQPGTFWIDDIRIERI